MNHKYDPGAPYDPNWTAEPVLATTIKAEQAQLYVSWRGDRINFPTVADFSEWMLNMKIYNPGAITDLMRSEVSK